ncbi:hypothetical protein [Burkholderia ubonensis]|uniref:hypothetical protein n=1 Tax=Burkholderia ubonensis TaxID=101571 RepID=UPI0012FACBEA|nr:hypothetical protein [Burkholderia ubonensis]
MNRSHFRLVLDVLAAMGVASTFSASAVDFASPERNFAVHPCPGTAPQIAAIQFFNTIEQPNSASYVVRYGPMIFSRSFLDQRSPSQINEFILDQKKRFGLEDVDRSFKDRLERVPQAPKFKPSGDVTVNLVALSGRGRILQRVTLTCESGIWKVSGFAYGAEEDY